MRAMSILLLLSLFLPSQGETAPPGELTAQEILTRADKMAVDLDDQTFTIRMKIKDTDGTVRERELNIFEKGGNKRLVQFTYPSEVKGMSILLEDNDTMYVYLPAYQKIRRVAAHAASQGIAGSDFSQDDMATLRFSDIYTPSLLKREGDTATLELKPKEGKEIEWSKLNIAVDVPKDTITRVEYFNKEGKLVKLQEREKVIPVGKYFKPTLIRMTDLLKNHSTELHITKTEVNTGLSDDLFSKRTLLRGR